MPPQLASLRHATLLFFLPVFLVFGPAVALAQPDFAKALRLARADHAGEPAAAGPLKALVSEYGTPLYIYDRSSILDQFRMVDQAFRAGFPRLRVFYALKANSNPEIVRLLRSAGAGAETVSGGEIQLAMECGVPGPEIIFTSSSKSPDELELAVSNNVLVNVDSRDELEQLQEVAARLGKTVRIAIRVNPSVDPDTIHQINTGKAESKFGIHLEGDLALDAYRRAAELPNLRICGAHCHIGSQITTPESYCQTAKKMLGLVGEIRTSLGLQLEFVDLGGGFGVPYRDGETVMTPAELVAALQPVWREGIAALGYEPELWIEPGRFFVAPAGFLLVRVNSVKQTPLKTFVNVDAGFNTLARPAMYGAYHRVRVVGRTENPVEVEIAGNVCETGDILATSRQLPRPVAGDLLIFLDSGAYGYSMASHYNSRPLPAEVMIDGQAATLIRAQDFGSRAK
jgi:diaminopimelate decarboxylase